MSADIIPLPLKADEYQVILRMRLVAVTITVPAEKLQGKRVGDMIDMDLGTGRYHGRIEAMTPVRERFTTQERG